MDATLKTAPAGGASASDARATPDNGGGATSSGTEGPSMQKVTTSTAQLKAKQELE